MSSGEEDHGPSTSSKGKRRRVERACDVCRRKKIRCDGVGPSGGACSNCIASKSDCAFEAPSRRRGPSKGYVVGLENRLERIEALLKQLHPGRDFTRELGPPFQKEQWRRDDVQPHTESAPSPAAASGKSSSPRPSDSGLTFIPPTSPANHETPGGAEDDSGTLVEESDDDDVVVGGPRGIDNLSQWLKRLELSPAHPRFFGKSSRAQLVKSALSLKSEITGDTMHQMNFKFGCYQRREMWDVSPWEAPDYAAASDAVENKPLVFPEPELMEILIARYFDHIHPHLFLLHRPSFEHSVAIGLHHTDPGFGALLLVLCALGARLVQNDPRVLLDPEKPHSAGWQWFGQVQRIRKSFIAPPRLYDIQMYALSVLYLHGSTMPQSGWPLVGIGIRLALDVGVHRRKIYSSSPTPLDEQWKRAFWVLVMMDRQISCSLGRPCSIQEEDFDVELPIECDDEYWTPENSSEAFKQPVGKPSKATATVQLIKITQILAFAMRTIYSINRSKATLGFVGQEWEQNIVAEIDSALNKWMDQLPDFLRWDPHREDDVFFRQSALLHIQYYQLQIIVHRPFIPNPRKRSSLSFPSLAICTNAARCSANILDILHKRTVEPVIPHIISPAFSSGVVLLLHIWGSQRSGGSGADLEREMEDVYKCMNILKFYENSWHFAGRLWDILRELASMGDLPLPSRRISPPSRKRTRDGDTSSTPTSSKHTRSASTPNSSIPQQQDKNPQAAFESPVSPIFNPDFGLAGSTRAYSLWASRAGFDGSPDADLAFNTIAAGGPLDGPPSSTSVQEPPQAMPAYGQVPGYVQQQTQVPSTALLHQWMNTPATSSIFPSIGAATLDSPLSGDIAAPYTGLSSNYGSPVPGNDAMALWSAAPTGFELNDWNVYVNEMAGTNGLGPTQTEQQPMGMNGYMY